MKTDTLYVGKEVRDRLISGIRKSASAVGSTMGTSGSNAILEDMANPGYRLTNDGATILDSIRFTDPIEEIGRKILVEAVSRANKNSGDGSSTTCVLTAAILEEGIKHLDTTAPMDIKRSLEACIPLIEESINAQKREITVDEVGAVASISAEDEAIGSLIQEIYQQIGNTGIVYWDISKTDKDSYTIGQGVTVEGASIASPYMCDRDKATGNLYSVAKMKNPQVILTKEKLTTAEVFEGIFSTLNNQGKKEVAIFCDDYDIQVIAQLVTTHQVRGFRTIIIKMPTLWNDQWYEDLALTSGATVLDPAAGFSLKKLSVEHLGTFDHLTVSKDACYIDGIKDVSSHLASLMLENTDDSKLRASRLNTKTARYYVGGISDSAISHRRYKVEDAIASAYHSLNGGIVAGGGSALASVGLLNTIGERILREALKEPARQIAKNAGHPDIQIGLNYLNGYGLDTRTGEFVNMFDAKIIDSATITMNAIRNAISVAANILTVNTLTLLPREESATGQPAMIV